MIQTVPVPVEKSSSLDFRQLAPAVPLPEKFSGDPVKFRGFIYQLELVFMLNPAVYSTEKIKVCVLGTLLSGRALELFSPYLGKILQDPLFECDYEHFKQLLKDAFEGRDPALNATVHISKLKQGNRTVAAYAAHFNKYATELKWNDPALIDHFRYGLNEDVKLMMSNYGEPNELDEFIKLAIYLENLSHSS